MIGKLSLQDINQVVKIHRSELHGLLSALGEGFLTKFYKTSLDIPEMFTLVAKENEQVLGLSTGVTRVNGLYKRIFFKDIFSFIWLLLGNFITHPKNSVNLAKSFTYPGFGDSIPELLTLAVGKNYRRRGIGRKLFTQTAKEFQKRGYKKFRVSVYDKLPANGFYKEMGCEFEKSFEFLGEKMNYFIYKLK